MGLRALGQINMTLVQLHKKQLHCMQGKDVSEHMPNASLQRAIVQQLLDVKQEQQWLICPMHWALDWCSSSATSQTHVPLQTACTRIYDPLTLQWPPAHLPTATGEMHQKYHSFGFFLACDGSSNKSSSSGWVDEPWTSHASWLPAPTC